ncbi:hypothetical protein GCM10027051_25100 [Niabella terrae]
MKMNITYQILFLIGIVLIPSCKKMDDVHRQFLDMGETIYVSKADDVVTRGGNQRIEISWPLISDPKISRYKIYWNNGRDSVEGPVPKIAESDSVRVLLDNMNEGIQYFDIYMFDNEGHSSIKTAVHGVVYGPVYRSSLLSRSYTSATRTDNDVAIQWVPASDDLVVVWIKYTDTLNLSVDHILSGKENSSLLKDVLPEASITYATGFLPDSTALDTLYTSFIPLNLK